MSSRRVQWAADVLAVAVLAVSGQVSVWGTADGAWDGGPLLHAALMGLITVPLLVRRRWPLVVLVLVSVTTGVQYELGGEVFQPWFALLLALYAVAAHADLSVAAAGAAVVAVVVPGGRRPEAGRRRRGRRRGPGLAGHGGGVGVRTLDASATRTDSGAVGPVGGQPSGTGRPGPPRRSPRSVAGSRGSCTTWSPTAWVSS